MERKPNAPMDLDDVLHLQELLDEEEESEKILGGGSSLILGENNEDLAERQLARQRDNEPDDFDVDTNVSDDRVRGAGDQSLDDLALTLGQGLGLESHIGGLRHDRPDANVNDPEPTKF